MLAVFLVGGGADAAQRTARQCRLQQVGGIHRAARGGARPDHRVDFVDEHDGAGTGLDFLDHRLETLFEIAAIAGAGQERAHVELEHGAVLEHGGHVALDDLAGQPLGDRRLAHARVADEERIVLLAAAQNLDGAVDFRLAADQRIDAALGRLLVEIDAIGIERVGIALLLRSLALVIAAATAALLLVLVDAAHRPRVGQPGALGDAVRNVVDRVVAGHVLLLQEKRGVALALGENGDQHIGAGHLLAARGLHMNDGALDNALEAGGGLRVLAGIGNQVGEIVVDIVLEAAAQRADIDIAGAHHRGSVLVVGERQQQMFQRGVFVMPLIGDRQRPVQGLLETAGECRHAALIPFPWCIVADVGASWQSPLLGSLSFPLFRTYRPRKCRHLSGAHAA